MRRPGRKGPSAPCGGYKAYVSKKIYGFMITWPFNATVPFAGFRFPAREVISLAVRWYLRYGLSYQDVGELLAERGVTVDHVTVCR